MRRWTIWLTMACVLMAAGPRAVWGVGPVFTLPTTTDPFLGSGKWLIGPTAVVWKQAGHHADPAEGEMTMRAIDASDGLPSGSDRETKRDGCHHVVGSRRT